MEAIIQRLRKTQLISGSVSILLLQTCLAGSIPRQEQAHIPIACIQAEGDFVVGTVVIPKIGTLFPGDRVETKAVSAEVKYRDMNRTIVRIDSDSAVTFLPKQVQLERGRISFETDFAALSMVVSSSNFRLLVTSPRVSATVSILHGDVSLTVHEGALRVVNLSGSQLAVVRAGEPLHTFLKATAISGANGTASRVASLGVPALAQAVVLVRAISIAQGEANVISASRPCIQCAN